MLPFKFLVSNATDADPVFIKNLDVLIRFEGGQVEFWWGLDVIGEILHLYRGIGNVFANAALRIQRLGASFHAVLLQTFLLVDGDFLQLAFNS